MIVDLKKKKSTYNQFEFPQNCYVIAILSHSSHEATFHTRQHNALHNKTFSIQFQTFAHFEFA